MFYQHTRTVEACYNHTRYENSDIATGTRAMSFIIMTCSFGPRDVAISGFHCTGRLVGITPRFVHLVEHDLLVLLDVEVERQLLLLDPGHVVVAADVDLGDAVLRVLVEDQGDGTGGDAATLELLGRTLFWKLNWTVCNFSRRM